MILPIVAYGSPILRKTAVDVTPEHPGLDTLIANMWETLYNSNGVGLAAPQINHSIRLFLVDTAQIFDMKDEEDAAFPDAPGIKGVFLNARILHTEGANWSYNEGCLSIPKIRADISRPTSVRLAYLNENFQPQEQTFTGLTARVILHEYDHLEGKLFIDHIAPLKRTLMKGKLEDISKGRIRIDYRMIFHK
jgi:peptide deformylase